MMPIEPSPVAKVDRNLGQPGDLIQGLEKRLVPQVEVQSRVGHLGTELLAQVGDRVARLFLKLLQRFAQPDSLAGDRDLARAGVDARLALPSRRRGSGRAGPCARRS